MRRLLGKRRIATREELRNALALTEDREMKNLRASVYIAFTFLSHAQDLAFDAASKRDARLARSESMRCTAAIVCTAKGFAREKLSQRSAEMLAFVGGTRHAQAPTTTPGSESGYQDVSQQGELANERISISFRGLCGPNLRRPRRALDAPLRDGHGRVRR